MSGSKCRGEKKKKKSSVFEHTEELAKKNCGNKTQNKDKDKRALFILFVQTVSEAQQLSRSFSVHTAGSSWYQECAAPEAMWGQCQPLPFHPEMSWGNLRQNTELQHLAARDMGGQPLEQSGTARNSGFGF